jgi:hypothetical protein
LKKERAYSFRRTGHPHTLEKSGAELKAARSRKSSHQGASGTVALAVKTEREDFGKARYEALSQ